MNVRMTPTVSGKAAVSFDSLAVGSWFCVCGDSPGGKRVKIGAGAALMYLQTGDSGECTCLAVEMKPDARVLEVGVSITVEAV